MANSMSVSPPVSPSQQESEDVDRSKHETQRFLAEEEEEVELHTMSHEQDRCLDQEAAESKSHEDQQEVDVIQELKPPDGGYGWVVLFAGLMVNVLGGCADAYAVFYMHMLESFNESNSATAWPGAICFATFLFAGPLAGWICQRFSHRVCCILGGVVGALGLVTSAFVPNIYLMYLTYGIIAGLGFCFQYMAATLMVGFYFEKRRTLAMCIGLSGVCIGDFIMPPLVELFAEYYAWQGAMIILAGISLHACVFGALMKPLPGITTQKDKSSCDLLILKEYRFVLYCFGECMYGVGVTIFFTIISDFAYHEGQTTEQGAWLLSVMGLASAVSRILTAALANHPKCDRLLLYAINMGLSILPLVVLPYTRWYWLYVLCSVLYGIPYGVISGLSPVLLAELFGLERMTSAYGYLLFFAGVITTPGPPIAGWMFDMTGSYEMSWLFSAACTLIGIVCCFTLYITNRYTTRRSQRQTPQRE